MRAAALLELGDPSGRDELLTYISLASGLGHARGRWGALTRRATFAQLAGQAEEAARLGEEALELGLAIGEPDAVGCFCTSRWSLVALGVREPAGDPDGEPDPTDPLWPMFPLLKAWPPAVRGDLETAAAALGDFSVLDIAVWTGLEGLAVAAVVFAAVGTNAQRAWVYDRLRPYAGTHVVVGGCASYHAAVDHHLGALAASLGDLDAAEQHFTSALAMHERLGAAGWARITEDALASLARPTNEFRQSNGLWLLSYAGTQAQVADSKGLHDLAVLIGAQGNEVHVSTLIGPGFVRHRRRPDPRRNGQSAVQGPAGRPVRAARRSRRPRPCGEVALRTRRSGPRTRCGGRPRPAQHDVWTTRWNAPARPSAPASATRCRSSTTPIPSSPATSAKPSS